MMRGLTFVAGSAAVVWGLPALWMSPCAAQFVDVSVASGIGQHVPEEGHGTGVAVADYDGDGDLDFFVPQAAMFTNRLYRNRGDGEFDDVAGMVGLDDTATARVALWIDYDGDDRLDLILANDDTSASSFLKLFRQLSNGQFVDVTVEAGLSMPPPILVPQVHHWGGMCAGDINNDGYLDIYTSQWYGPGHLFLNQGDGTFQDISDSSGVSFAGWGHQPVMHDFNGDRYLDIYVAIDFEQNQLWINQQDNTFANFASFAGVANAMNDMGVALGDYDNDGDFDMYVTNIYMPPGDPMGHRHNVLYRNESVSGAVLFDEVSHEMGVEDGAYGWGAAFFDYDNDGDLDLAATNGWRSGEWVTDQSRFFVNPGDGTPFVDDAVALGFDDTEWGSPLIPADFDRDGKLDVLQVCMDGPVRLLRNVTNTNNNYLTVRLSGAAPNPRGIGAIIRVRANGLDYWRRIGSGGSYMGQLPAEAHFGIGRAEQVEELEVTWPGGGSTLVTQVDPNKVVIVSQISGTTEPIPVVSTWGLVSLGLMILALGTIVSGRRSSIA